MLDVVRRSGPTAPLSSVRNAARVLKAFSRTERELGVTELARRLGLTTSTVHRLLVTLVDEALPNAARGACTGSGSRCTNSASRCSEPRPARGRPFRFWPLVRQSTMETVQMGVLDGLDVVYVERLESPQTVRIFNRSGHRIPAHATSSGKALLAHLPAHVLQERLLDRRPTRLTPHTITERGVLQAELTRVAERGWTQNIEEGAPAPRRWRSRARPGRHRHCGDQRPASVSRARRALPRHRVAVVEAAALIATRIGHRAHAEGASPGDR